MAEIAITQRLNGVPTSITFTQTTANDTLTAKQGLLFVRNGNGTTATLTLDGAAGGSDFVPGFGIVNTAPGYQIAVPANATVVFNLADIGQYLRGVVAVTGGGAGITAGVLQ